MAETRIQSSASSRVGRGLAVLLAAQPLLDVLSFFMLESGHTAVTTTIRFLLLGAVSGAAFLLAERKRWFAVSWGAAAAFWLLHACNCLRVGYADPVGDAAEFLKLIQLPLWAQAFVVFFRRQEGLEEKILPVLAVNLALILGIIGLSFLVGRPVFTYEYPERGVYIGVLGWFGVANAQSALLCLLVPGAMLWALQREKLWLFSLCSAAGCALLYATGTRLAFFAAVLWAAAFLVVVFLCRKPRVLGIPLLVILALLLAFRGVSPMERRQAMSQESFRVYQEKIDALLEETPGEAGAVRVLQEIYGQKGVYGETLLEDLLECFGTQKILEKLEGTTDAHVLNNSRSRKLMALELVWEEEDSLTHLLGMEYAKATIGPHCYDPENDLPDLVYYYGWLGAGLYGAFLLGALGWAAVQFFRRFPTLVDPPFLIFAGILAVGVAAAALGGQVLRRPNVTVYLSLAAAQLWVRGGKAAPRKEVV